MAARWPSSSRRSSRPMPRRSSSPATRSPAATTQLLINAAPRPRRGDGRRAPSRRTRSSSTRRRGPVIEFTPGDCRAPARRLGRRRRRTWSACACDVERAFGAAGRHRGRPSPTDGWYLLQARPITTPRPRMTDAGRTSPSTWLEPVRRRAHVGMGRHAHAGGADAARRRLRPASSGPASPTAISGSGVPFEIRDPGLERLRLLRARDGRPRGRSRPRCGERRTRGSRGPRSRRTDAYWQRRAVAGAPRDRTRGSPRDRSRRCRAGELAEAWDEVWAADRPRAGGIHFYAIRGPYQVLDDLADLYESVVDGRRRRARRSG